MDNWPRTTPLSKGGMAPAARVRASRLMGSMVLVLASLPAHAQVIDVYSNYEERLGSRLTPTMQGVDTAFGAKTNIATGSISFSVPVLSIPGNSGLDISVTYKLSVRDFGGATQWNFEEDKPYLSGSFSDSAGWTTQFGGTARCSNVTIIGSGPPDVPSSNGRPGTFYTNEYWSGYFLSAPDGGGRLNKGAPAPPTSGGPFHWVTNGYWYFSCIPLSEGSGEGFIGHSPDGLKYFFDTMREGLPLPALGKHNAQGQEIELDRKDLRIYAGRIEDRFGNYLTGLTASDGRSVTKVVSGDTTTYTYGTRQWVVKTSNPFTVTYPDGSTWSATISGTINNYVSLKGSCPGGSRTPSPSTTTVSVKSPAGATGTYTLKQTLIGYSYVSGLCLPVDSGGSNVDRPSVTISPALVKRVVSGPGLATQTLDIDYGSPNDCYSNTQYWSPKCTSASPTWRTITYSYSDGRYERYTFGNRVHVNADLLLKLEEGAGSNAPQRTTEYEYSVLPNLGTLVGSLPYGIGEHKRAVMVQKVVTQDGESFKWEISSDCGGGSALCIDDYGRPTKIIKSSTL